MMTTNSAKVTIHMVASLDGFIAKKDNSISWMHSKDSYDQGIALTEEHIAEVLNAIDCYIMGSGTYEHALQLGWPYGEVPTFVLTSRTLKTERENVEFFSGDLQELVNERLKPNFKNMWMVGGAQLTKEFLRLKLADHIIISIMPVLLGGGTLFFNYIGEEHLLHLQDVTAYKDGMVELTYQIRLE